MAKKKDTGKFRAAGETGVTLHVDGRGAIRVEPDTTYETDHPGELEALRGSADVREMDSKK